MRRPREGGLGRRLVAGAEIQRQVARGIVVEERGALGGGLVRRGHDTEILDVEHHGFRRVAGLGQGLGHHQGDRLADIAHLADAQRGMVRLAHRRAVLVLERQAVADRPVAVEIGGGDDRQHAGHGERRLRVDAAQGPVGDRAAHEHAVGLAVEGEIVGIAALAAHQHGVLGPRHRLADAEFLRSGEVAGVGTGVHAGDSPGFLSA